MKDNHCPGTELIPINPIEKNTMSLHLAHTLHQDIKNVRHLMIVQVAEMNYQIGLLCLHHKVRETFLTLFTRDPMLFVRDPQMQRAGIKYMLMPIQLYLPDPLEILITENPDIIRIDKLHPSHWGQDHGPEEAGHPKEPTMYILEKEQVFIYIHVLIITMGQQDMLRPIGNLPNLKLNQPK